MFERRRGYTIYSLYNLVWCPTLGQNIRNILQIVWRGILKHSGNLTHKVLLCNCIHKSLCILMSCEVDMSNLFKDVWYFKNGTFQEAYLGTRPSYAWRSILHGREAMNLGLVKRIGDGKDSNVWSTNWLVDTSARPPMYRQDSLVDLMLKVCDLFIPNKELWDREKVRETFTPEDAQCVLRLKPSLSRPDCLNLNLHYLVACTKKRNSKLGNFKTFPWILWNLW